MEVYFSDQINDTGFEARRFGICKTSVRKTCNYSQISLFKTCINMIRHITVYMAFGESRSKSLLSLSWSNMVEVIITLNRITILCWTFTMEIVYNNYFQPCRERLS